MNDPLSQVIALLQPRAVFSKRISGAGRWGVRYSDFGHPSFCVVLEGSCRLAVDGQRPLTLEAGDFVLLPTTPGFTMSGFEPVRAEHIDPKVASTPTGEVRHGDTSGVFQVEDGGIHYILTQFEATDARDAFPCFDEPSFKVPWQLTLHVPAGQTAMSNTPAEVSEEAGGGRRFAFARTAPLPSYLIAFAVGPIERADAAE